jgi:hypothetical protein
MRARKGIVQKRSKQERGSVLFTLSIYLVLIVFGPATGHVCCAGHDHGDTIVDTGERNRVHATLASCEPTRRADWREPVSSECDPSSDHDCCKGRPHADSEFQRPTLRSVLRAQLATERGPQPVPSVSPDSSSNLSKARFGPTAQLIQASLSCPFLGCVVLLI